MAKQAVTRESHVATSELITVSSLNRAAVTSHATQEEAKLINLVGHETGSNKASFK